MAGNSVIGALRVVLGADTGSFEDGLKGADAKLTGFASQAAKAGAAIGVALAAAGTAIAVGIKHAIDAADNLGKSAQKIGIPVEQLSALKHAADLSGVSLESLEKSVGKLSKGMLEAATNPMSQMAKGFNALGISVKDSDGNLKSSTTIMTEVAGKFENMKDGASKTAIAMALFGRSGAELIPLLNSGKAGLAAMTLEAEQLGIVIDTKTAKAAEAFNDNLTRLGKVKAGIIQQVTAQMLPAFLQMSQVLIDAAKSGDFIKTMADNMTTGLRFAISAALETVVTFQRLGAELSALGGVMSAFATTGKGWSERMSAAWASFRAEGDKTEAAFRGMNEFKTKFWADAAAGAEAAAPVVTKKFQDINFGVLTAKTALDAFINSQLKSIAAQNAEVLSSDLLVGAKERAKVTEQAYAIAKANSITVTEALKKKINDLAAATEAMTQKVKGAHLVQEAKEPHEKYRLELANNEVALKSLGATAEQMAAVQTKTAERYGNTWQQVAGSVAGSVADMGNAFSKESKAMAMVAKIAGAIQASIAMFTGAAQALTLPFPANLAAMATVLAAGAKLVASIKSTSVSGFKTGGSIRVPGGMGGGDRVPVSFMAQPGEQIDIWRPGEAGGDPRGGAGVGDRTITLRFEGDDFNIGQKMARKIVSALNEAMGNGARLQVA